METNIEPVEPVFIKCKDILPEKYDFRYTPLDICYAAEHVSGKDTINGCENIRGLMRLYPKTRRGRNLILTSGLTLYDTAVTVYNKNPFILREGSTKETPATRVLIGDIPISVANSEIERALARIGCELRSSRINEKARNRDGKLTPFLTGRRFVYISTPSKPLERTLDIKGFSASILHREQDAVPRTCRKCLQPGHGAFSCTNEMVCMACRLPGHRRGDSCCPAVTETAATAAGGTTTETHDQQERAESRAGSDMESEGDDTEGETETESEGDHENAVETADKEAPENHVHAAESHSTSQAERTSSVLTEEPEAPSLAEMTKNEDPAHASASHASEVAANTPSATVSAHAPEATKDKSNEQTVGKKKDKKKKKKKSKEEEINKEVEETARLSRPDKRVQTTLNFESRPRSQTPNKRPRENDGDSPQLEDRRARLD